MLFTQNDNNSIYISSEICQHQRIQKTQSETAMQHHREGQKYKALQPTFWNV